VFKRDFEVPRTLSRAPKSPAAVRRHELLAHTTPLNSRTTRVLALALTFVHPRSARERCFYRLLQPIHFNRAPVRIAWCSRCDACANARLWGEPERRARVVERLTAPYELWKKSGITLGRSPCFTVGRRRGRGPILMGYPIEVPSGCAPRRAALSSARQECWSSADASSDPLHRGVS
jgi:hypothetical protein